ncbi:MAG: preprotein translocase subunit SecE [Desulfobacterales bacterium]
MGRLQRKKAAKGKKKQKQGATGTIGTQSGKPASSKNTSSVVASPKALMKGTVSSKKAPTVTRSVPIQKRLNYLEQGIQFLREVKAELKKVTWSTRKQTIGSTVVVLILVMIISFFLGLVDIGLSNIVRLVLG